MNADDTFSHPAAATNTPRWRALNLSDVLRDVHTQAGAYMRNIARLTTHILCRASQQRQVAQLTFQSWEASARASGLNPVAPPSRTSRTPHKSNATSAAHPCHADAHPHAHSHAPHAVADKPSLLRSIRWVETAPNAHLPLVHLRLSGRLSDVCDELDRLIAIEARR